MIAINFGSLFYSLDIYCLCLGLHNTILFEFTSFLFTTSFWFPHPDCLHLPGFKWWCCSRSHPGTSSLQTLQLLLGGLFLASVLTLSTLWWRVVYISRPRAFLNFRLLCLTSLLCVCLKITKQNTASHPTAFSSTSSYCKNFLAQPS